MKKRTFLICLLIIFTPIILGLILNIPTGFLTIGDESSWVGFFGNYSGGIIGGIVAVIVAKMQVNDQINRQIKNEEENKFINQMPALISIKYELVKMKNSISYAYKYRNRLFETEDSSKDVHELLYYSTIKLYQLRDENWANMYSVTNADFHADLIELKNLYIDIQAALNTDINKMTEQVTNLYIEINHPNDAQVIELEIEIEKAKQAKKLIWNELNAKNYLEILDNHISIIDIVISSIKELQEEREKIRDGA
ncbi:hypothetical protein A616_04135 [Brevibacillus brevis X23]|nr:hypothetical protein A616_04135 [Brevibacillus brevis X23]